MRMFDVDMPCASTPPEPQVPMRPHPLHRLGIVRQLQGISRRTLARHLNTTTIRVAMQEEPASDILLSQLYQWQRALGVPAAELLGEADNQSALPLQRRAQLVRVMKTVLAIYEAASQESIRAVAKSLIDQLIENMPELRNVHSWHAVGNRRRRNEFGVMAERRLSEDALRDLIE